MHRHSGLLLILCCWLVCSSSFRLYVHQKTCASTYRRQLAAALGDDEVPAPRQQLRLARAVAWILKRLVILKTEVVTGLTLNLQAPRNRQLLQGKIDALEMSFERIEFGQLIVSGGGRLTISDLNISIKRLLFSDSLPFIVGPYYLRGDILLTQADIVNSGFIRSTLQLLIDAVVQRAVSSTLELGSLAATSLDKLATNSLASAVTKAFNSVSSFLGFSGVDGSSTSIGLSKREIDPDLLRRLSSGLELKIRQVRLTDSRIVVRAEYTLPPLTPSPLDSVSRDILRELQEMRANDANIGGSSTQAVDSILPFEVSLALGTRADGQVLFLRDLVLVLNPDTPLLRSPPFPILLSTPVEVDLGERVRLSSLEINDRFVALKAALTICPLSPDGSLQDSSPEGGQEGVGAQFTFDLAKLLAGLLSFKGGLANKIFGR